MTLNTSWKVLHTALGIHFQAHNLWVELKCTQHAVTGPSTGQGQLGARWRMASTVGPGEMASLGGSQAGSPTVPYTRECTRSHAHMFADARSQTHTASRALSLLLQHALRWPRQPRSSLVKKPQNTELSVPHRLGPRLHFYPAVSGVLPPQARPPRAGASVVSVSCVSPGASGRRDRAVLGLVLPN